MLYDAILIDEARIPLVIAGNRDQQPHNATRMARIVSVLKPEVHFEVDTHTHSVYLTEEGICYVERELGCDNIHAEAHAHLLSEINLALHARELVRRDIDYIIREEGTGTSDHGGAKTPSAEEAAKRRLAALGY